MMLQGIDIRNFIAIDFETAVGKEACQIGIAVVKNYKIADQICKLIKPPGNKYNWHNIQVHGITPEKTEQAQTFPEVWAEVSHLFDGAIVVAHNAPFDMSVLAHGLETNGLTPPDISAVIDTCAMSGRTSLDKLCREYRVKLGNHHDALCDATACAELLIRMTRGAFGYGEQDDGCDEYDSEPTSFGYERGTIRHDFAKYKERVINVSFSELDRQEQGTMEGMNVVITGVFRQSRDEIAARAYEQGATVLKNICKKMNCIIVGDDPGPVKMDKLADLLANGADITVYQQEDVDRLLFSD